MHVISHSVSSNHIVRHASKLPRCMLNNCIYGVSIHRRLYTSESPLFFSFLHYSHFVIVPEIQGILAYITATVSKIKVPTNEPTLRRGCFINDAAISGQGACELTGGRGLNPHPHARVDDPPTHVISAPRGVGAIRLPLLAD